MKRVPPTISRTLDLIERRRVYTLHMLALQNQKPIVENDPEEPPTAVETRQKKRRYYREMEYHFGEENLAYIRQFKKSRDSEHANAATMYGKRSPRRYNFALNYRNRILFDDDSEDGRSTVNNDDDASETSEQILERLGLESGMTVYDRAISPRSGMMSFKKKPIIIHPQSARGQRPQPPINYSTTQTQTLRLRRRRVFLPHPPSDGYGEEEGQNEFYEEFYEEEEFFEEEINEKESDHIHKEEETLSENENENENLNEEETLSENENNNHDEEETKTETEKNDSELISESTKRKEEELASKLLHEEYDKVGEPENDRNDFDSIASKAKSLTETSDSLSTLNPSDEEYRKNREERIANAMKISEADKKYCSEEERYKNSEENNISQALRSESEALKLEEERRNRLDRLKQIEESEELRKRLEESELRKNEESEYAQQKREREEEERKRREMEEEERRRREEEERKRREMEEEERRRREEEERRRREEEERRRREEEERRRREEEEYRRKQFEGEDIMNRGLYDESDRLRDLSDARKMESDARREESDVMKLDSDANKMESDAQTIEMLKSTRINMLTGPINQNEKDSDGSIDDDFVV